jgi:hypothetical protein
MLQTASTKIQTPNFITTAIRRNHFNHSHRQLSLSYTLIIQYVSSFARKKNRKNYFAILADENFLGLAQHLLLAAILAVFARSLPFWQISALLAGYSPSCQPAGSAGTPLLEGVTADPVYATNPFPSIGGAMSLANQTKLICQISPI